MDHILARPVHGNFHRSAGDVVESLHMGSYIVCILSRPVHGNFHKSASGVVKRLHMGS